MVDNVHELRPKVSDTEKITINIGYVDLGHIDLLVQDGFYANRTDFIRTAIRNQIERHADAAKRSVTRKSLDLGLRHYSREELEAARSCRPKLHIHVLGLASIALDVTPELARATIGSVVGARRTSGQPGGEGRAGRSDPLTALGRGLRRRPQRPTGGGTSPCSRARSAGLHHRSLRHELQ